MTGSKARKVLLITCSILVFSAPNGRPSGLIQATTSTLEQWVDARKTVAKTKSDWASQRETLEATIALYQGELGAFEQEIGGVTADGVRVRKETEDLETAKASLDSALDRGAVLVTEFEQVLKDLAKRLPPPLVSENFDQGPRIGPLLVKIPEDPANTKIPVVTRMRNVVGMINQIEKFNGGVFIVSEVRKNPEGADVMVRTVYMGLGQAYSVDDAGKFAGVGIPTREGWKWVQKPELAKAVQNLIGVYESTRPAAFVGMPVEIN